MRMTSYKYYPLASNMPIVNILNVNAFVSSSLSII